LSNLHKIGKYDGQENYQQEKNLSTGKKLSHVNR